MLQQFSQVGAGTPDPPNTNLQDWLNWWATWYGGGVAILNVANPFFPGRTLLHRDVGNSYSFLWDEGVQGAPPAVAPADRIVDDGATVLLFQTQANGTNFPGNTSAPMGPNVDHFATQFPTTPFFRPFNINQVIAQQAAAAQAASGLVKAAQALAAAKAAQAAQQAANVAAAVAAAAKVNPPAGSLPAGSPPLSTTAPPPASIDNKIPKYTPVVTLPPSTITAPATAAASPNPAGTPATAPSTTLKDLGTFAILTSPAWLAILAIEWPRLKRAF